MAADPIGGAPNKAMQVAEKLAALPRMSKADLRAEWRRLFRSQPPPRLGRDLMVLALGWKIQEKAHGGLTLAEKRRLTQIADDLKVHGRPPPRSAIRLKPGAKLIREWHGKTHHVLVLDEGFEWNHRSWRSLSVIAREITGTPWSGPRFFGLQHKPEPFVRGDRPDG